MAVDKAVQLSERKTLFLLGSGASYGHRGKAGSDTPPLMKDFLVDAVRSGVMNDNDFPQLAHEIKNVSGETELLKGCEVLQKNKRDFEAFLELLRRCSQDKEKQEAQREIEGQKYERMRRGEISFDECMKECQELPNPLFALETSRFLIHKFIGRYCATPVDDESGYTRLAKFIKAHAESVVAILTLNYDTISERALDSQGIRYDYGLSVTGQGHLPFLKPHGSVNFRYPLARLVLMGHATDWQAYIRTANSIIQGMTVTGFGPRAEVYKPDCSLESDFWAKPGQPIGYMPMLVQPFKDKSYDQLPEFKNIWYGVEQALAKTDLLVVIGCRMRSDETRLWDRIGKHLKAQTIVRIVGFSDDGLAEVEGVFQRHGFKNTFPLYGVKGFHAYALDYLDSGAL